MSSINDSINDLLTGVDMTGLASAEGPDINNAINLAVPIKAGADETVGRGLILTTIDTALNVPDVPDPTKNADYTKFKRYQWNRRPFAGAATKGIQVYQWNDDAAPDAILLNWVPQVFDTSGITATANNALGAANNAVAIANNAQTIAGTANTTANDANAAVAAATLAATNAKTTADAAQTTANAAQATANTGLATANQALAIAPKQSLYTKFSETKAKGTDAGASLAGKNTRVLNTVDFNGTTANVSLDVATGLITINTGGYYLIKAFATLFDNSNNLHQLFLVDNATGNNILEGFSMTFVAGGSTTQRTEVEGIALFTNGQVIRLDHYITNPKALNGLGQAANINPNAAGHEVYSAITLLLIGAN